MYNNLLSYVPILKWKEGEYQALFRLPEAVKDRICPLIEACPPGYDFETGLVRKTIDDQLKDFGKRIIKKWSRRSLFIDFNQLDVSSRMCDGSHPAEFVLEDARRRGATAIPVTGFDRTPDYQHAVLGAIKRDGRGLCLRFGLDDIVGEDFDEKISSLLSYFGVGVDKTDLLLDLGGGNFEPVDGLSEIICKSMYLSVYFHNARRFIIAGTSFPRSMKEINQGSQLLNRGEWLLYKDLVDRARPGRRVPIFGDYAIAHPTIANIDMRKLKIAATIRYTIDNGWLVVKGLNVKDHKFEQYRRLCGLVVDSSHYLGARFSEGSRYIDRCMRGEASTGRLTTWRWVGTNHHISKVAHDLAIFHGT